MNCIVTAGPTGEPLDEVRRLTNFSTGTLSSELANFLVAQGHHVTLLLSRSALYRGPQHAQALRAFSTTADLQRGVAELAAATVDAVFHAAAVGDFKFGKIWERSGQGELTEVAAGKVSTRRGVLLAELVPTVKVIRELRSWFPHACLVGWKYEVDGPRQEAMAKAEQQMAENQLNACVANGPAYGPGFGLVTGTGRHAYCPDKAALYVALEGLAAAAGRP